MTIPVHRITDSRVCGAETTPAGNSDVFANNLLVAVNGDPNSHGSGGLIAHSNEVYADNILTVNHTADNANADDIVVPPHDNPATSQGSPNVFTGDPNTPPPVPIPAPEIERAVIHLNKFIATNESDEGEPAEPIDPVSAAEMKPDHVATPEISVAPAQEIEEAQTHEDICHPFDGILDQILLEAKKGEWMEKGQVFTMGNSRKLPYFGAVSGKHVYQKPDGTADTEKQYQNAKILKIWDDLGGLNGSELWESDQLAWCMGFVNWVLKNAGYKFLQSATANHIHRTADYESTEIKDFKDAKCGDIAYWDFSHVSFVYSNDVGKCRMSFVGGNQGSSGIASELRNNNPEGGSVTHNWAGTSSSPYNTKGVAGGVGSYYYGPGPQHNTAVTHIYRPKKI